MDPYSGQHAIEKPGLSPIAYNMAAYQRNWGSGLSDAVVGISRLALVVIAILGVTEILPNRFVGWCAVGIGSASLLFSCCSTNERICCSFLNAAIFVTIGALGGVGIIGAFELGWTLLALSIASYACFCCKYLCCQYAET